MLFGVNEVELTEIEGLHLGTGVDSSTKPSGFSFRANDILSSYLLLKVVYRGKESYYV